jgi:hypothetical protein
MPDLPTEPVESLQNFKGIDFPGDIRFRQILVTGPPGAGKSTLIRRLGGWSEEGYLDLAAKHWWRSEILSVRPREIHLGMPFCGLTNAVSVFDAEFLDRDPLPAVDSTASCCRRASAFLFRRLVSPLRIRVSAAARRAGLRAPRSGPGIARTRWTRNSAWRSASRSSTCFAVAEFLHRSGFLRLSPRGMETRRCASSICALP